jgi:O-antigen/teichoic acid export membrane protein
MALQNGRGVTAAGRRFNTSLALISSQVARLVLGAVFWIVAARLVPAEDVGLAAAAIALIGICVSLSYFGTGAAVIRLFPGFRAYPRPLLAKALRTVLMSSLVLGAVVLVIARWSRGELSAVSSSALSSTTFLAGCIFGALVVLGDQVSIAMWRGRDALLRAVSGGGAMILALAVLASIEDKISDVVIVFCWTLGMGVAVAINGVQLAGELRASDNANGPRLLLRTRELLRVGVPNHVLSLLDIAPAFVLTLIVAETLAPETAAYWYTVWMASTAVLIIPGTFGMTLFAAAVESGPALGATVRQSVRNTLAVGGAAALCLAAVAGEVLRLFGDDYAEAGTTPLRVLMLGIVPLAFVHAYLGACRATDRTWEAARAILVGGSLGIVGATIGAVEDGLVGVAVAWLAAQALTAIWAAWRLRRLVHEMRQPRPLLPDEREVDDSVCES